MPNLHILSNWHSICNYNIININYSKEIKVSLIKWKPLNNEIDTFDNIIDQFFSDISIDPRFSLMNTNSVSNYYNENEKEYYLTMDVPGMSKDDIEVAFDNDRLKITGQRKSDKYDSYEYGQIEKTFNVPNNVETDKISAKIDNGVLKVLLPKAKSSLRRKITIK